MYTNIPSNLNHLAGMVQCSTCQGLVLKSQQDAHDIFHDTYINREEVGTMSSAAWCDPGNHAFQAGEPGSQRFSGTSIDAEGNPVRMEMDACKEHSFQSQAKAVTTDPASGIV